MLNNKKPSVSLVINNLHGIWQNLSLRRKKQALVLLLLMLLGGLAEAVSLSLVVPFLAAMAAPEKLIQYPLVEKVFSKLKNQDTFLSFLFPIQKINEQNILLLLAALFITAVFVAGAIRVALVWANNRLAGAVGTDFGQSAYIRTLFQPYAQHLSRNSSHLLGSLMTKVSLTTISMAFCLSLITSMVLAIFLIVVLLLISSQATLLAGVAVGLGYCTITLICDKRLKNYSFFISQKQDFMAKTIQEGIGGIRDVLLDGSQAFYADIYRKADALFRRANANIMILGQSPRYIMETIGMAVFAALAFYLARAPDGLASSLPVLGALALGVQRLLPILQQAFIAWSSITAYQKSTHDVIDLLQQPLPKWATLPPPTPLLFRKKIHFEDVKFCYSSNNPWILNGLSLTIPKGSRVGFVGTTGSGKSTCLDLLMGLLEPTEGQILIDETPLTHNNLRAWQRNIAHVPQAIYLSDSTLAENIAFGLPAEKIDMNRVREVARRAQIADFIESSPKGYQALVGERGIRLSGGQRQRIGIARALYKQAQVLVFDEATSALDHETENAVMRSINSLSRDLTILIIAHRTSTLENCDQIIDLDLLKKSGSQANHLPIHQNPTDLKKIKV